MSSRTLTMNSFPCGSLGKFGSGQGDSASIDASDIPDVRDFGAESGGSGVVSPRYRPSRSPHETAGHSGRTNAGHMNKVLRLAEIRSTSSGIWWQRSRRHDQRDKVFHGRH